MGGLMRTARLQPTTIFLTVSLTVWFALDFVGGRGWSIVSQ
jgi:hypothetical protein